jgi:hypothetical protein
MAHALLRIRAAANLDQDLGHGQALRGQIQFADDLADQRLATLLDPGFAAAAPDTALDKRGDRTAALPALPE